jgi:hypothetical protein
MTLPVLSAQQPIVNPDRRPSSLFLRFMNETRLEQIRTDQRQDATAAELARQLALINEALQLAGLALETADAAGTGTARSGSAMGSFVLTGTGTVSPVTVPLLTVSAGNLTIPGTGPSAMIGTTAMTGGTTVSAEYDIVELPSATVVFSGTFTVNDVTGDEPSQIFQVVHTSAPDVAALNLARAATGSVSYRVDVRRVSGANMTGMRFYLFARRS